MKKIISITIIIINIFMLTACWNYRDLSEMAIVSGFAVDKGENGKKYHLTIEIIDLSGGEKESKSQSKIISTDGNSISDAIANTQNIISKELYWSNCAIVLISQDIAKEGIAPLLDWLVRDDEMRLIIHIKISLEKTAGELLKSETPTNKIHAYELDEIVENNISRVSKGRNLSLYDVVNTLGSPGISLALSCFKNVEYDGEKTPEISDLAVFKKDKLIGFLSEEDTKYFLYAIDKVGNAILVGDEKNEAMKGITLKVRENKTTVTPEYKDGKLKMKIKLKTTAEVEEVETSVDLIDKEKKLKIIKEDAEKMLSGYVTTVIKKVQTEFDSDIFGFGNSIYKSNYKLWEKIEPDWDEIFKTLEVEVDSDIRIRNTGETKNPIKVVD